MSIEAKLEELNMQIQTYQTLSDANKIGKGNEITKLITECEKSLNTYNKTLDEHVSIEVAPDQELITQDEFIECVEKINILEQLLKTSSSLDTMMSTYTEMSKNVKKCEKFLVHKQMNVNII